MPCGDLEEWDEGEGGRSKREGIFVYIQLIHFLVQQKLTQHCKANLPPQKIINKYRIQFSSVAQSCPTLCDPMNRSMPGLPVHHW